MSERRRLPDERMSITHRFSIAGHSGYLIVGMYDDGSPGEIFVYMSKVGSVVAGLMDAFATSVSLGLQYGVPLDALVAKFSHSRFEPSGFTTNPQIPIAKSIMDYIFRWLGMKFLPDESAPEPDRLESQLPPPCPPSEMVCPNCGDGNMQRSGTCHRCNNCGTTSGCS